MHEMTSNQHSQVDLSGALGHNSVMTQNVLLVRFVSANKIRANSFRKDAQIPENTTSFVHRYPSHSLRGSGPSSAFLQQAPSPSLIAALSANSSAQYRLSSLAIRDRSGQNRQTPDSKKFMNLQVDDFSRSSIYKGF